MRINLTKQKLKNGETVFGTALQHFRSAEIPRVYAAAGFDYFFIDLEHGSLDLETTQDIIAASVAAGVTPLVRPAELLYSLIARMLDLGAQGIVLPRVEDPEVLREALSWMTFPPHGKRGFGVSPALFDYEPLGFPEIMKRQDEHILTVVQFETKTALERADELLSVPGIDVAMVGPADLSISLGMPGDVENREFVETVMAFMAKCQRHGVAPGIHSRNVEGAKPWVARGMKLIGAGGEFSMFLERARQVAAEIRSAT